jgi:DNA-binding phage protein
MLEKFEGIRKANPTAYILDPKNLGDAITDCLLNNDPEGIIEVLEIYLETLNKEKLRNKAKIGKSTYYSILKGKNPTIKTLAKVVSSIT